MQKEIHPCKMIFDVMENDLRFARSVFWVIGTFRRAAIFQAHRASVFRHICLRAPYFAPAVPGVPEKPTS